MTVWVLFDDDSDLYALAVDREHVSDAAAASFRSRLGDEAPSVLLDVQVIDGDIPEVAVWSVEPNDDDVRDARGIAYEMEVVGA